MQLHPVLLEELWDMRLVRQYKIHIFKELSLAQVQQEVSLGKQTLDWSEEHIQLEQLLRQGQIGMQEES